jgi:probable HAF family extracellular repeat protein
MTNTASGGRSTAVLKAVSIAASIAIAVLGTASAALHGCPPEYEYEMACAPPCGPFKSGAVGLDINEAGDIVGYATGICYGDRAFIWKAGLPSIQFLPMPAGTSQSRAYGINDKGQIVGYYVKSGNATKGFMIDNGVFFDMGTLPGGNWSEAYDVNDDGVAVGWWGNNVVGPSPMAMSWQASVMTSLTPMLGQPMSIAYDINGAGAVTGYLSPKNYLYDGRAFILDGKQLTVLPPAPGAHTSTGAAINSHGDVAGWGVADCDPPGEFCIISKAFLWNGTDMISLGALPGFPSIAPSDLNDDQMIVGTMAGQSGVTHAFLWDNGELHKLNDLVIGFDEFTIGTGFVFAINNTGQIAGDVSGAMGVCALRLTPKPRRPADLDCDRSVGASDLAILIQTWGAKDSPADLNGDGSVDAVDLGILLGDWDG